MNALRTALHRLRVPHDAVVLVHSAFRGLARFLYGPVVKIKKHSVAGLGVRAAEILAEHHLDYTPCSARSPFGKLAPADGWVLMLGIGMDCCTLVHHGEETVAVDTYLRPASETEIYSCRDHAGNAHSVRLRRHKFRKLVSS